MVQKRPAAAPAGGSKRQRQQDPIAKQCWEVTGGLSKDCDVPEAVSDMLASMVPESLGIVKDARHEYQQSVAEMICGLLAGTESAMREAVAAAQAVVDGGTEIKAGHEAAVKRAGEQCAAAEAEANTKKLNLAGAAASFQECKKAVKIVADEKALSEREAKAASAKKSALEGILKDLVGPLTEGTVAQEEIVKTVVSLQSKLKKFQITESLNAALPDALSKPPAERSSIDTMVVSSLADETGKLISGFDAEAGEAVQAGEHKAEEVRRAEAALEDAKAGQLVAADKFKAARDAHDLSKHEVAEAERQLKQGMKDAQKNAKALYQAVGTLEVFQNGPLAAASSLKEREEVVEEEAPAEAEETSGDKEAAGAEEPEASPVAKAKLEAMEVEAAAA